MYNLTTQGFKAPLENCSAASFTPINHKGIWLSLHEIHSVNLKTLYTMTLPSVNHCWHCFYRKYVSPVYTLNFRPLIICRNYDQLFAIRICASSSIDRLQTFYFYEFFPSPLFVFPRLRWPLMSAVTNLETWFLEWPKSQTKQRGMSGPAHADTVTDTTWRKQRRINRHPLKQKDIFVTELQKNTKMILMWGQKVFSWTPKRIKRECVKLFWGAEMSPWKTCRSPAPPLAIPF